MNFRAQHEQAEPLLIGNVWDVTSAQAAEAAGFEALGTSSAAMAAMLGFEDGEQMPFGALLFLVKRLVACVKRPLSVDLEGGYSRDPNKIADHVEQLAALGVVGVNLEDSVVVDGERQLLEAESFAALLQAVRAQLTSEMFINVRTDAILLGGEGQVAEGVRRATLYEAAGADGLFVPGAVSEPVIARLVASSLLPLNVMCLPNLPRFGTLRQLGVRRISMGNFMLAKLQNKLADSLQQVLDAQSAAPIFEPC